MKFFAVLALAALTFAEPEAEDQYGAPYNTYGAEPYGAYPYAYYGYAKRSDSKAPAYKPAPCPHGAYPYAYYGIYGYAKRSDSKAYIKETETQHANGLVTGGFDDRMQGSGGAYHEKRSAHKSPVAYAPGPVYTAPAYKPAPSYHAKRDAYDYGVADDYTKANLKKTESQNAEGKVIGSFVIALPDGRIQPTKYPADHYHVPDVTYEGTPVYPPEPKEGYGYGYNAY